MVGVRFVPRDNTEPASKEIHVKIAQLDRFYRTINHQETNTIPPTTVLNVPKELSLFQVLNFVVNVLRDGTKTTTTCRWSIVPSVKQVIIPKRQQHRHVQVATKASIKVNQDDHFVCLVLQVFMQMQVTPQFVEIVRWVNFVLMIMMEPRALNVPRVGTKTKKANRFVPCAGPDCMPTKKTVYRANNVFMENFEG